MLKRLSLLASVLVLSLGSFWFFTQRTSPSDQTSLDLAADSSTAGFARATKPSQFQFPKDHGPHFDFQTEWWYYTGNLQSAAGDHYGYQLTIFRRGLTPGAPPTGAALATNQIYFAHFAITNVKANQHTAVERFSRGADGLAGAQGQPFYHVWIEDWNVTSLTDDGSAVRLQAHDGQMAIDLSARSTKPIVAEGPGGLSQKSEDSGNASYYLSFTRMATQGQVTIDGQVFDVSGLSWFDHEWSTSALGQNVIGWNWFSLQLNDGREIMFYQLRTANGGFDPVSAGTLVEADGSLHYLKSGEAQITFDHVWHSPITGADYPVQWHLVIPSANINLSLQPYVADQEMHLTSVYWEGAVHFAGVSNGLAVAGDGYVEMTGYKGSLKGTF